MYQALESTQPKCLWCLKDYNPYPNLASCLVPVNLLCQNCQSRLNYQPRVFYMDKIPIYSLYRYDQEFSRLLIQYKEARDVVLAPVFLSSHIFELRKRYWNKAKILMPSSQEKIKERGFNHLSLMYQDVFNNLESPYIKLSTRKQVGLSKSQRADIHFDLKQEVTAKSVVLLDDVITTGSTFKEAIRLLPNKKIQCFSIAYKP